MIPYKREFSLNAETAAKFGVFYQNVTLHNTTEEMLPFLVFFIQY